MSGLMEVPPQRKNSSLRIRKPSLSVSLPSLSARFPSKPYEILSYALYLNGFRLIREPFFIGKLVK